MIIRTIQEVNQVSCCSCALPECADPRIECESARGFGTLSYEDIKDGVYYKTVRKDYADGGFEQWTREGSNFGASWETGQIVVEEGELVYTSASPLTGASTITWLDPLTPLTEANNVVDALANDLTWGVHNNNSSCVSSRIDNVLPLPTLTSATFVRYRFGVPSGYSTEELPRTTWEMTWDEITASLEWWTWYDGAMTGDEPAGGPTLVVSKSWIWGGDMDSPWSDWNEMTIPDRNCATRVANILITCWKSTRHGSKPTESGDQIAL